MLWVELCPPEIHVFKPSLSASQNTILFGNNVIADVISYDGIEWALNQYDGCPYEKGGFEHRHTRGDTM